MEYFKNLPMEITLDILTRLPIESVLECKSVCKNWRSLVRDSPFSKMHLHHLNHPPDSSVESGKLGFVAWNEIWDKDGKHSKFQYFEYDENHESTTPFKRSRRINLTPPFKDIIFVGSCNGLICFSRECFSGESRGRVYICNPITREYVVLPQINTDSNMHAHIGRSTGFGYVSSKNEYKVVGMYSLKPEFIEVHIYTLGSGNGWRTLGKFNFEFDPYYRQQPEPIFANGILYWMKEHLEMIVTFDLAEEKFSEYLLPPPLPLESNWCLTKIGVLNRFLFCAVWLVVGGVRCYDVWILKKKNDHHCIKDREEHLSLSWNKEFTIDDRSKLLAVTMSDNVLTYTKNYLNIYDPKASTSKRLMGFEKPIRRVFPHKNTLVSLKELGEEDTKTM